MERKEILELIKTRRAMFPRQFTGAKIPNEEVKEMLEAANWAPTHKYTEPWRFKVYTGLAMEKLVAYQKQLYVDSTLPDQINQAKLKNFDEVPQQTSHIIAIIMHRNPIVPEMEEIASVAMAVQNLWLTVAAYGYGGYWSTGGGTFNPHMQNWVGIKEDHTLMGFFYMGVHDGHVPPGKRRPIDEKVEWA
jgi:nitroreductase